MSKPKQPAEGLERLLNHKEEDWAGDLPEWRMGGVKNMVG